MAWARLLGRDEFVSLLDQTLEEEKAADKKLTALAEQEVNLNAASEGREEGEEQEEVEARLRRPTTRRQAAGGRNSRAKAADRRRR